MINKIGQYYVTSTLMPALKPSIGKLTLGTFAEALAALTKIGALLCLIQLIDDLSSQWVYGAIGLWLVSALISSCASWLVHDAESLFSARVRRQVAKHLTRLPSKTLSRYGDNQLRRLASEDINTLHHMIAHLPGEFITFILVPCVSIIIMLNLAGPVALITLLPGLMASLYYLVFLPKFAAKYGAERMNIMGDIVTAVNDYVRGIRVNRIYGSQSGAMANYNDSTQRFTHGIVKWVGSVALPAAIAISLLQAVATFALAYTVTYQMTPAAMASVFFFGLAVVTPVLKLGHGLDYVAAGKNAAKAISEFLRETPIDYGSNNLNTTPHSLKISDITVINNSKTIIRDLTYSFSSGTVTSIMGPSGAGKTTLLRILAGQEKPNAGSITIDNLDVSQLSEESRHNAIRYLPQNMGVLKTTIKQNLLLTAPDASDDMLRDALDAAQLDLDLNSDASILSGGQQQRVALASVFLCDAKFFLLDEPTSALDQEVATVVMNNLIELAHKKNKSIVLVTHDSKLAQMTDFTLSLNYNAQLQDEEV
ncbi:ABC transporter ATP-binding protein/permease [Vibrio sp. Of14-4]|uniref:ATP-binding cassette domain-containing protein n=1 Tax=Vibrio sp. Of14-4 TaxID=2724878 RepID=UPI001EF3683B|nr:ABC transporter ATP-binding protein [Vibrio sp. Of14-4]MCG7488013.1 ABC transporter ATP-binding protein/permease [Vibrio sp. Of14-4]